jgi:hypothetical protein
MGAGSVLEPYSFAAPRAAIRLLAGYILRGSAHLSVKFDANAVIVEGTRRALSLLRRFRAKGGQGPPGVPMTLSSILIGLAAWMLVAIVVGLGLGRWLGQRPLVSATSRVVIRPFRNRVA